MAFSNDGARTVFHLALGFVATLLAILSLMLPLTTCVSIISVLFVDIYVVFLILEAAKRSSQERTYNDDGRPLPKDAVMFEFPSRTWMLLQVSFLVTTVIFGFANMFLQLGCGVLRTSPQQVVSQPRCPITFDSVSPGLSNELDAVYFSMVTLTTVGYGDFVPATPLARKFVIWELITGLLLLVSAFPILISRLADF